RQRAALPGAIGADDHGRGELPLGIGACDPQAIAAGISSQLLGAPRLPKLGPGPDGGLEQQEVEMLASEGATPSGLILAARHSGFENRVACEQSDALHLGACLREEGIADPELTQ